MTRYEELKKAADELGITEECAEAWITETIAKENESIPNYVKRGLNAAIDGKIKSKDIQKYLDRKFGFNEVNTHVFFGCVINRHKLTNEWYIT